VKTAESNSNKNAALHRLSKQKTLVKAVARVSGICERNQESCVCDRVLLIGPLLWPF